jgi:hypothetical protein
MNVQISQDDSLHLPQHDIRRRTNVATRRGKKPSRLYYSCANPRHIRRVVARMIFEENSATARLD